MGPTMDAGGKGIAEATGIGIKNVLKAFVACGDVGDNPCMALGARAVGNQENRFAPIVKGNGTQGYGRDPGQGWGMGGQIRNTLFNVVFAPAAKICMRRWYSRRVREGGRAAPDSKRSAGSRFLEQGTRHGWQRFLFEPVQ